MGGLGKTSLVYHLAWMFSELQVKVLAMDLDPQANLTAAFIDESILEITWQDDDHALTVFSSIQPLVRGTGDIRAPLPVIIEDNLSILCGDLSLSAFADELSSQWPAALSGNERAFRVLSAFWRVMQSAAESDNSQLILMDMGPNLGSINRAALIAADYVVMPLAPDLFSLQGLRILGPTFFRWRREWMDRVNRKPAMDIALPEGRIQPLGYVLHQHGVRLDRPVKAYDRWIDRIPSDYRTYVLGESPSSKTSVRDDPHCLARLKHYGSLMPMAQEARKPMFHLKPADGAIGAHFKSAQEAYRDFEALARTIAARVGLSIATDLS
jgi:chromosome partitioning protein